MLAYDPLYVAQFCGSRAESRASEINPKSRPRVITPHPGELARLLGDRDAKSINAHRIDAAREAARIAECVVVLKGHQTLIADRDGTVHMLFCLEYMRCFYQRSTDEGETWSTPVEITGAFDTFRAAYPWKVLATGPGHGIQLSGGRLLVPVWLSTGTGGHAHRPSAVSVIISDDHGKTWQRGEIVVKNPNGEIRAQLRAG